MCSSWTTQKHCINNIIHVFWEMICAKRLCVVFYLLIGWSRWKHNVWSWLCWVHINAHIQRACANDKARRREMKTVCVHVTQWLVYILLPLLFYRQWLSFICASILWFFIVFFFLSLRICYSAHLSSVIPYRLSGKYTRTHIIR